MERANFSRKYEQKPEILTDVNVIWCLFWDVEKKKMQGFMESCKQFLHTLM